MNDDSKSQHLHCSTAAQRLGRRAFLHAGTLWLLGSAMNGGGLLSFAAVEDPGALLLRIGLLTDLHYADRPPVGTRHYREALPKLRECVSQFNAMKPDFVVEVGDLIDAAETADGEIAYLKTIEAEYARLQSPRHYVLGNHCVWTLTKEQFQAHSGAKKPFYSFDQGGWHFVILDGCYRADGVPYGARNFTWTDTEIPGPQRAWLEADLRGAQGRTIVFVHQRLDVQNDYAVKSAPAVRHILESSGKVAAVFQGHSHQNDYREINGIHYCTLAAMIEGSGAEHNAYALLSVFKEGPLKLEGFRTQKSYQLATR